MSEEDGNVRTLEPIALENPWLDRDKADILYHLGLNSKSHNLQDLFGDVKFVCMGGTTSRMRNFAQFLASELDFNLTKEADVRDLTGHAGRYSTFKVGPVLSISHGIGCASLSILLHEVLKLLFYSGCTDVTFFRIGTSGGIGLDPGTVVVTDSALNELLSPCFEVRSLGRRVERPCQFDQNLVQQLRSLGHKLPFPVVSGTTLCTHDFYEGQGRMDGAFCDYDEDQKMSYMYKLQSKGVKNIEMESQLFGATMLKAGVKGAVVCVTLLDRLQGDQVVISPEDYVGFQDRPQKLVLEFIRQSLTTKQV